MSFRYENTFLDVEHKVVKKTDKTLALLEFTFSNLAAAVTLWGHSVYFYKRLSELP